MNLFWRKICIKILENVSLLVLVKFDQLVDKYDLRLYDMFAVVVVVAVAENITQITPKLRRLFAGIYFDQFFKVSMFMCSLGNRELYSHTILLKLYWSSRLQLLYKFTSWWRNKNNNTVITTISTYTWLIENQLTTNRSGSRGAATTRWMVFKWTKYSMIVKRCSESTNGNATIWKICSGEKKFLK